MTCKSTNPATALKLQSVRESEFPVAVWARVRFVVQHLLFGALELNSV